MRSLRLPARKAPGTRISSSMNSMMSSLPMSCTAVCDVLAFSIAAALIERYDTNEGKGKFASPGGKCCSSTRIRT